MKLVTIATFQETATAGLAQSQLQSAGINAYLADAEILNTDWLLNNALGGIKLQVANDDEQRARELLAIDTDPAAQAAQEQDLITLAGDDSFEDPDLPPNAREQLAERIYRGAVASLLAWPLSFAVIWYAIIYYRSNEPVSSRASNRAFWGTVIASPWPLIVLAFMILFVIYIISGG